MEDFNIAILQDVCLSCLESNGLPNFPLSNIHNRHVKCVTVLKCNTTTNNNYILKKYFFCLMLCMNTLFYAIIYPPKHKMCLSCYLRYILPSEIESFLKGICS